MRGWVLAFLALAAPPATAATLRVATPVDGSSISGPTTLQVATEPPDFESAIAAVTFTVDGELACRVEHAPFACEWNAGASVAPHHVRAVASLRAGGRLVANARTIGVDSSLAVAVDLVQVTATVSDRKGHLVRGLKPEDFRVREDGAAQEVSHFLGPDAPREIVVAVDMSGSMEKAMPSVRQAVQGFLAALRPDDHVTLLAFNDGIFTLARRETDAAARARAVERLRSWGGTALYDVILKATDMLDQRKGRKALVVFSDGDDESSRATIRDVEKRAERSDAPVYMIGQGRGAREPRLKGLLDRLARLSGGRAFHTEDPEELRGVFTTIVDELDSQYLLAYGSTKSELDGSWRVIEVEAGPGRSVRARQGYRAESRP